MARLTGRLAGVILILSLLLLAPASACVIDSPFNEEIIDEAETIIRGRVVAYEPIRSGSTNRITLAKLTFDVVETYRGLEAPSHSAFWSNSTFGLPADLADFMGDYGDIVIVGLGALQLDKTRPEKARKIKRHAPELFETPWVKQAHCAPAFMGRPERFEPILRRRGVID